MPQHKLPFRHNMMSAIDSAVQRLDQMCLLPVGWDGYDGLPVSAVNALFAVDMLKQVVDEKTPPVQIVPGVSGDIQLEWHTKTADLELHIKVPGEAEVYYRNILAGIEGDERRIKNDFSILLQWLRQMNETDGIAGMVAA